MHTNHPWGIAIFEFKFNRIGRIKRVRPHLDMICEGYDM